MVIPVVACVVSICIIFAAAIAIAPCVLSSKISREEEKETFNSAKEVSYDSRRE